MQQDFSFKKDFRISRLNLTDVKKKTDIWFEFRNLILTNEPMYPGIGKWLDQKVAPSLGSPERVAYVGYIMDRPIVSAVLKRGSSSKFCHLRIDDSFQQMQIGDLFFALMCLDISAVAAEVHFTLPEHLWEQRKEFFQSFSFEHTTKAHLQYRLFEKELRCSTSFKNLWMAVLEKLPDLVPTFSVAGHSLSTSLLLSVKPNYAEKILALGKTVEIRRKFSEKWIDKRVAIYASHPISSLVGEARIRQIVYENAESVWETFGSTIGCSKKEFYKYAGIHSKLYAIELDDVLPYRPPVSRQDVTMLLGETLQPPQSYRSIQPNDIWSKAVSIAALLQCQPRKPIMVSI